MSKTVTFHTEAEDSEDFPFTNRVRQLKAALDPMEGLTRFDAEILRAGDGWEFIINCLAESHAKARDVAELALKTIAAGFKTFIRRGPEAVTDHDFEKDVDIHAGRVTFITVPTPGSWQDAPEDEEIVGFGRTYHEEEVKPS